MIVPVYILTNDSKNERARLTLNFFNDKLFSPILVSIDAPSINEDEDEVYRFKKILEISEKKKDTYFIFIKESCTTQCSSIDIADIIRSILSQDNVKDITYLATWNEQCTQLENKRYIGDRKSMIADAISPMGTQALLITESGRSLFLNNNVSILNMKKEIKEKRITADVLYPSMFVFDIIHNGENSNDLSKTILCSSIELSEKPTDILPSSIEELQILMRRQLNDQTIILKEPVGYSPLVIFIILLCVLLGVGLLFLIFKP